MIENAYVSAIDKSGFPTPGNAKCIFQSLLCGSNEIPPSKCRDNFNLISSLI